MSGNRGMVVSEYLKELKESKKGKPHQIREALDIYVELWDKAIAKGTVSAEDEVGIALAKLDDAGGLYKAAE